MSDIRALTDAIAKIDGRGYKSYRDLERTWEMDGFTLIVDRAQSDPFAAPSRIRVLIDPEASRARRTGTAALLARDFAEAARARSRRRGIGRSGEIRMEHPGQVVLEQSAVRISDGGSIEARFTVGLPARGRRIDGAQALALLVDDVPYVVASTLLAAAHDSARVDEHATANETATALRAGLHDAGLIAFVADGASLARMSGNDDRPLDSESAVPFVSPESLRVELRTPSGPVAGMGIPEGITLIVGGGFHGKSTLLRALQSGVYDHMPGDGRERVVTRSDGVKVRAEDGRSVAGVDISPFIDGLPLGRDTRSFTSPNASGSTSQAAGIVEAIEAGARLLLIDEDTSANNFMVRDRRMQELVPKEGEPITPFVDRARTLHDEAGVSTVLVLGGSGDYLDVADRVVRMRDYLPEDVTSTARAIADRLPTGRRNEAVTRFTPATSRTIQVGSLDPKKGRRSVHVKVPDDRTLLFGPTDIDLAGIEQLATRSQIRAIGLALAWVFRSTGEAASVETILDEVEEVLASKGIDGFSDVLRGDLAAFRRFEMSAALNRLRRLRVE